MKKTILFSIFLVLPVFIYSANISPTYIRAYLNWAEGVMQNGDYRYAMELYETVIKMDTDNTEALIGKGNCYRLTGDIKMSDSLYERARAIKPNIIIPGIMKYTARDMKKGSMSNERIKKAYHELMAKIKDKLIIDQVPISNSKVEAAATGDTIVAGADELVYGKNAPEDRKKMLLANKELWIKGGRAKMASLGGIRLVYQDMSTAMDGAAFGIDTGFLFRRPVTFLNLSPYAGYYYRNSDNPDGLDTVELFNTSTEYSLGDVSYTNENFLFCLKPAYQNSQNIGVKPAAMLPPVEYSGFANTGSIYGGNITLGLKPAPVFAMAGSCGYEYNPYAEYFDDGRGNSTLAVSLYTRLNWQAGMGINITEDILKAGELDITSSYGTYHPEAESDDIKNRFWFWLPRSMLYNYTRAIVSTSQVMDPMGFVSAPWYYESTVSVLNTTGYNSKTNAHWMYGNGLHEIFAYFEVPHSIKFTTQTDTTISDSTDTTVLGEVTSTAKEIGSASMFIFKTGFRSDFHYLTAAFKYENSSKSFNFTEPMPQEFLEVPNIMESAGPVIGAPYFALLNLTGEMYENSYRITAGVNIKPVWVITIPVEYEYYLASLKILKDSPDISTVIEKIIRVGLELKPAPVFSFRGGMSYDTILNNSPYMAKPGTELNPIQYITGWHAGIGIDSPTFEWNITAVIRRFNSTPKDLVTLDRYYLTVHTDMNFYM